MHQDTPIARRRLLAWGGGVAALGMGLGARAGRARAADAAPLPVTIVNPQSDYNNIIQQMLISGGYLKEVGLDAKFVNLSDGSKIIASLISGSADICGGGGFSGVFPAIAHGAKIKILAGASLSPLTAIYAKDPAIRSTHDLIGKTVGSGPPGALLQEEVVALLQKTGVDYKQVKFANIGSSPDVFKAVLAGTVDAGPGEIGYASMADKYGVHVLSDGMLPDELPLFTIQAFIASDQTIATKREALVRTLAAHAKLFRFISRPASHQAFFEARKIALGVDKPEEAQAQWEFFQHPNRLDTNLVLSQAQTDYIQNLNVELGLQKDVLPFDQVADMSLARDAINMLS